jgi:hypothetical protein
VRLAGDVQLHAFGVPDLHRREIPRDELPLGLGVIGEAMPVTHALEGLRSAYAGAGIGAIGADLALEAEVGAAYATLGYVLFRAVEIHARRSGAYAAV